MIATQDYGWSQLAEQAGLAWPAATEWAMTQAIGAGLTGWEPLLYGPDDALRVGNLAHRSGLAMTSVFVTGPLHEPEQAAQSMDRLIATVRVAAEQGCRLASVYPSPLRADDGEDKSDSQLAYQARQLATLAEAFHAEGVQLLYHPEDREMRHAAREFHHMLLATSADLVGLCLDPDTIWRGAGGSMVAVLDLISLYGHRVEEIHIRQSQNGVWSEVVEVGDLDYLAIQSALSAKGKEPLLVLEHAIEPGTPSTLTPIEAHRRSLRFIRDVFEA